MEKSITCLNCGKIYTGYYCPDCGQPAKTARITIGYVWREVQRVLFYRDAGVYYTISQLIIRPGHMIREYLEGKRAKHYKPFYLFFYLSAVYILVRSLLGIDKLEFDYSDPASAAFDKFLGKYYGLTNLLVIPIYSLSSFIFFRKFKLFFGEHFMLNMYVRLLDLVINFILMPIQLVFVIYLGYSMDFFSNLSFLISFLVAYYAFYQFFQGMNFWSKTFRFLGYYIFSFVLIVIIVSSLVILYLYQTETIK